MQNKKTLIAAILTIVFLIAVVFVGLKIKDHTDSFKFNKTESARQLDFNNRLLSVEEAIPVYGDFLYSQKKAKTDKLIMNANASYKEAVDLAWILVLSIFAYIVVIFFLYFQSNKKMGLAVGFLGAAIACIVIGLCTPMLEMSAYKEELAIKVELRGDDIKELIDQVPFIGGDINASLGDVLDDSWKLEKTYPDKVYFYYQNKGILDVISVLMNQGNLPIALIIGLFSIIVPFLKICSSFIILMMKKPVSGRFLSVLAYLTKFSMLDVFVIALFVTYFSFTQMNAGVEMSSNVLMGAYFFTAYVICAMISGIFMKKIVAERRES